MKQKTNFNRFIRQFIVLVALVANGSAFAELPNLADLKGTKLDIGVKQGKIIEIMDMISKSTDYVFVYEDGIKKELNKQVEIKNDKNLHDVLSDITRQSDLEFRAVNKNIVVRKRSENQSSISETNNFQTQRISGKVTSSEDNSGLPGVNIVEKGTTNGTVTDIDGNYSLEVPGAETVLVFSSVGFMSEEITVGMQSIINLNMMPDVTALDEIVVTALGIKREERSLGYSVGQVTGDEVNKVSQENVLNGMAGKIAGVSINQTGAAGSSVTMIIRGATSLTTDNQPLFVVDGVPMNNSLNNISEVGRDNKVDYGNAISDINPDDIASISVLKGPSAAALYGSRAGNGVVLITTKSGSKRKGLGISVSTGVIFEKPYKYVEKHRLFATGGRPYTPDNYPTNEYGQMLITQETSAWIGPALDKGYNAIQWPYTYDAAGNPLATPLISHPDNYKNYFETGSTWNNNISIANETDKGTYRLSLGNMSNKGVIPNTDLNRTTLALATALNLTDNFKVSTNISVNNSSSNNRAPGNRGANPLQHLVSTNSQVDIEDLRDYWVEGYEGLRQKTAVDIDNPDTPGSGIENDNPFFLAYENLNSFNRERLYGNLRADWQITKEFSIFGRYSQDGYNEKRETKISNSYSGEPNGAYGLLELGRVERNIDFLATYAKVADTWSVNVSAGGNARYDHNENTRNATKTRGSGLIIPNIFTLSNIANDNLDYYHGYSDKVVYSAYGLASFGYRDMIYLDVTGRNDWSSTLPEANRSFFYPSISGSILFDEMFSLPSSWNLAKVRVGWAQVGNDTDPYRLEQTMGQLDAWGNVTRLTTSGQLLTPDLKPEIQTSFEVGADLGFFDNRLRLEGTYYTSQNENQIFGVGTAPSSGSTSKLINAGLIESTGVEIVVGGTPISNNNFSWDINFVYSQNKSILKELPDGVDYLRLWNDAKGGAYSWIGDEIGQIIDRSQVVVEPGDPRDPSGQYVGWPILDDEGWDDSNSTLQELNEETGKMERVAPVIGNFNPDFMLGVQTALRFKSFSLSASLDWRAGGQFVSQTLRYNESDLQTERFINTLLHWQDVVSSRDQLPQWLKDHESEWITGGVHIVGGPDEDHGGIDYTEGGITLQDGTFYPGVIDDGNGGFIENLGAPGNTMVLRYGDNYPWSYTKAATFDADYVKIRDIALTYDFPSSIYSKLGLQNLSFAITSRNLILWTKAGINIDPETAFQPESGSVGDGSVMFKQGIERFNVNPWVIPLGFKLNFGF